MSAPEMICRLMQARTGAHLAHLKTMSFAAHKALEDFYSGIVDLVDSFTETSQGISGLIQSYPDCPVPQGDPIMWLTDLRKWLKENRSACCEGEFELLNLHDEILGLVSRTLYKLKYLDNPTCQTDEASEAAEDEAKELASKDFMKMSKW